MSFEAWLTLAVTVLVVATLATDRFQPAVVMGVGVVTLFIAGVIGEDEMLAGFGSDAPITVAALYILAHAAEVTGAFDVLTDRTLGQRRAEDEERSGPHRLQLARFLFPAMGVSAFIANTPLVAMTAPRVMAWCRRSGRSPSRYLMPLSYAIIFGGCITVLGTSTNLVVAGLLEDASMPKLDLFDITAIGLPVAILGTAAIVLIAPLVLKVRETPGEDLGENMREFTVEMLVPAGSPLAGKTIADAGLRNLEGVFLVEIERAHRVLSPVPPTEALVEGDRLVFAGNVGRVLDLERINGLVSAQERHFARVRGGRTFAEAVIGEGSPLVGRTVKQTGFRSRYDAAVVAIHRSGARVPGKLGDERLGVGDVLLLLADHGFVDRWRDTNDFLLVAPLDGTRPVRRERAWLVRLLTLFVIAAAAVGALDLLQVSLVAALAVVATGTLSTNEARHAVDLNVILLMALSFGLGLAMETSGLADEIARILVTVFDNFGDIGILAGILVTTMLMTELLSNNAAAVLMFPIAVATATRAGLDPRPFAVAILFGASLSFLTPIGYQANTLVWGMGGYRYKDFTRLGAPLTLLTAVAVVAGIAIVMPLRP
jgi:di/tricarboxylate transporter